MKGAPTPHAGKLGLLPQSQNQAVHTPVVPRFLELTQPEDGHNVVPWICRGVDLLKKNARAAPMASNSVVIDAHGPGPRVKTGVGVPTDLGYPRFQTSKERP